MKHQWEIHDEIGLLEAFWGTREEAKDYAQRHWAGQEGLRVVHGSVCYGVDGKPCHGEG